jgi:hypothetical protein
MARKQQRRRGESRPSYRSISLWKNQNTGPQAIPDPLKHFFRRCRDQHRFASDAVEWLDALFRLDDAENVLGP